MDQNDRNIYVDHLRETFLSESLENVDLKFDLTDMNISECIPVISPTKRPIDFSDIIYSNCKRIKVLQELNLNEKQDGNGLVHQLKSLINLANNLGSLTEKQSTDLFNLITIFNETIAKLPIID